MELWASMEMEIELMYNVPLNFTRQWCIDHTFWWSFYGSSLEMSSQFYDTMQNVSVISIEFLRKIPWNIHRNCLPIDETV